MRIYPVILCGGAGTRLWPASRPARPKQFIPLVGEFSLFQNTVHRLAGLPEAQKPIVVAGAGHKDVIARQLRDLGSEGVIIVEPEGRDSAPAIAAAAGWIAARDPDGIAVVVASDHHIPDAQAFCRSVIVAAKAAALGRIVTFGVRATGPATAYGYIEAGAPLSDAPGVYELSRFVEKPDAPTAQSYISAGYLWNSGNFVFGASTLIAELNLHAPEITSATNAALLEASDEGGVVRLGASFSRAPKISIDYALMERTSAAAVAPVDFAWSDLGAWDAVWAASVKDHQGNCALGASLLVDSKNCLVRNDRGPMIVGVGLKSLALIGQPDAVLVCDLDGAQGVKQALDALKRDHPTVADGLSESGLSLCQHKEKLQAWLFSSALPVWWALGADHVGGGFREKLDQAAGPVSAHRRARVQARQIYSFAVAGRLGWRGPWKQALTHGLDYLFGHFERADGLLLTLVSEQGEPIDDTATIYDQAFALLAMATASSALPDRWTDLYGRSAALLSALKTTRANPAGGFIEAGGTTPYYANPHMHLLEAALSWESASGAAQWSMFADELAELAVAHFVDGRGALREWFGADWSPAAGEAGRIIEPGHQFEWSWLLEKWGRARGRADARGVAKRLYEVGNAGVDQDRGVAMNSMTEDFAIRDAGARLWPQTEWLKAALIHGDEANAILAAKALGRYLEGVSPGVWRDQMRPDGSFVSEPAPASSLYHIVCAISELAKAA